MHPRRGHGACSYNDMTQHPRPQRWRTRTTPRVPDDVERELVVDDDDIVETTMAWPDSSGFVQLTSRRTSTPAVIVAPAGVAPVRILFVDDDPLVLRSLQRALRGQPGQELHFTSDPTDVQRLIASLHIDVVVCDQMMPVMCGLEVLSLVRRLYPKVLRVMFTGNTEQQLAIVAINSGGIDRFENKPWDNTALRTTLATLATQARARRDVLASALSG